MHDTTQPWLAPRPDTAAECEAAAAHWAGLATQEEARLSWDRHACPAQVAARASLYRTTAADLTPRAATAKAKEG